ncbi:allantoate deiminase [Mariprofundus micogutta]|uniref:Allantoate deiminase n=1 Tax=Mariprofundus micogutta TaxID=1921010 RepID=A0A1L8CLB6_9PROT|nr:hydantoinase/carbamoylase family amidase [Mariprofundus micogutta]GAV19702.1 allantoate deiminase [Mariprofundus micogutta]
MASASLIHIDTAAIAAHYDRLHSMGGDIANGFDRPAYSNEESMVMQYFAEQAELSSLNHHYDSVGNLVIESTGAFDHWIETGSHVDTVPGGGNFDGLAGVVAGFVALHSIIKSNRELHRGLRLRIWRAEESAAFGIASIGSLAAFGQLPASSLGMDYRSKTLRQAMSDHDVDPAVIETNTPSITTEEKEHITAYIELHIEQGKVLETEQCEIGIVTAIRGSKRSWVKLTGTFDHSGATPMGYNYRQDCNLAMAYMHVRLDTLLSEFNTAGADLVQTIGIINGADHLTAELRNNAVSKVSGVSCFSFEVRGCEAEQVSDYSQQAEKLMQQTAAEFGISVEFDTFSEQGGIAQLDASLQSLLAVHCDKLELSHINLPSGAWHDAGTVAQQIRADGSHIPTAMIFIPCKAGISHSPLEHATDKQIANGTSLLANTMLHLAAQD